MRWSFPLQWLLVRLAGKPPLIVGCVLLGLGVGLFSVLPVMRLLGPPKFRAPVTEVQNPRLVEPFVAPKEEARERLVTIQEAGWERSFREPLADADRREDQWWERPVRNLRVVTPEMPIVSPDGTTRRILAIAVAVNQNPGWPKPVVVEGALYGADLRLLSADASAELETRIGGPDELKKLSRVMIRPYRGVGMRIIMEEDHEDERDTETPFLVDAQTGRIIAGQISYGDTLSHWCTPVDGKPGMIRSYAMHVEDWRGAAANLIFQWAGDQLICKLPMEPGWRGECGGVPILLQSIRRTAGGRIFAQRVGGVVEEIIPTRPILPSYRATGFRFSPLPPGFDLLAYSSNPARRETTVTNRGGDRTSTYYVVSALANDEVAAIGLQYTKNVDRTVVRLPFIPGFDEENRLVEDFTEIKLPATKFESLSGVCTFLTIALQRNIRLANGVTIPVGPNPMEFSAGTVGDILQAFRTAVGPHALRLEAIPSEGSSVSVIAPHRATANDTGLSWFLTRSRRLGGRFIPLGMALVATKIYFLGFGARTRRILQARGFADLTLWEAEELWLRMEGRAEKIPRFEDLAAVPGIDPTNMESIAEFMDSQKRDRRG